MCDICSSPEKVYKVEVEGIILNACERCASLGKIVGKIRREEPEKKKKQERALTEANLKAIKSTETVQIISPNYSAIIRKAREKLGLKQEELAKKLAEKESTIHKLESGSAKPNLDLARKLERFLKISIIEEVELESPTVEEKRKPSDGLTLGDLIHIKQK
jgi:putative transcription factor